MTNRKALFAATLALLASSLVTAIAQDQKNPPPAPNPASSQNSQQMGAPAATTHPRADSTDKSAPPHEDSAGSGIRDNRALRLEGEKRFQANCGRCHVAPPKFPPRAMATILRHMRVRALITDEDRRLILRYMTE
jgi:mono/diheme cytochrome c family protein